MVAIRASRHPATQDRRLGSRVLGSGLKGPGVQASGSRVQGFGLRVVGSKVSGFGL